MLKRSKAEARRSLLLCLFVLGLVTAVILVPYQFATKAAGGKGEGLGEKTVSHEDAPGVPVSLPNLTAPPILHFHRNEVASKHRIKAFGQMARAWLWTSCEAILIGSGLDAENAASFHDADGAIVGTAAKEGGLVGAAVDRQRVERIVRAFKPRGGR